MKATKEAPVHGTSSAVLLYAMFNKILSFSSISHSFIFCGKSHYFFVVFTLLFSHMVESSSNVLAPMQNVF